jgi:hypothetical protein
MRLSPKRKAGEEIVYPKEQAASIAKKTQAPVLYTASSAAALHKAVIPRMNETGADSPDLIRGNETIMPNKVRETVELYLEGKID